MKDFFSRHEHVALLFSGGKDSLACLELCQPFADQLVIVWVNTGKNLPEVEEFVREQGKRAFCFVEVRSGFAVQCFPTDVIVDDDTRVGKMFTTGEQVRVCSKYECCAKHIWRPIEAAMQALDCTGFIKGQREDDTHKAPWDTTFTVGGRAMEMLYPIRHWSAAKVYEFLEARMELPEHLYLQHSSFDCWDCTAYWDALSDRLPYLEEHHPCKADVVKRRLNNIKRSVQERLSQIP